MTCDLTPPPTLAAFLDLIDTCARSVGGPDWPSLALTGLLVLLVPLSIAALLVWRSRE